VEDEENYWEFKEETSRDGRVREKDIRMRSSLMEKERGRNRDRFF